MYVDIHIYMSSSSISDIYLVPIFLDIYVFKYIGYIQIDRPHLNIFLLFLSYFVNRNF